jgi:hypothetical protein
LKPPARDWTTRTPSPDSVPHIPNYLFPAIISTCCFFGMPFGVVSIIYAVQVNRKAAAGNLQGAINASQKAKKWLVTAILVGLLSGIISGILQLVSGLPGK